MWILGTKKIYFTSPGQVYVIMSDTEKLDIILTRFDKTDKVLARILELIERNTPAQDFILNIGANILGNLLYPGSNGKDNN